MLQHNHILTSSELLRNPLAVTKNQMGSFTKQILLIHVAAIFFILIGCSFVSYILDLSPPGYI